MKTAEIKDILKKDLLIVELPENGYYEVFKHGILFKDHLEAEREFIEGSYAILGSPDEIKDEDLDGIVSDFDAFQNTGEGIGFYDYKKGFFDIVEKEIYWVNPWGDRMPIFIEASPSAFKFVEKEKERWKEAQEKTFDRNRTLIFIKN